MYNRVGAHYYTESRALMVGFLPTGRQRSQVPGVIDTLTAGYNLVNRHPWLLVLPLLLDVALWWGPQLSVAPLIADLMRVASPPPELGATTPRLWNRHAWFSRRWARN